MSIVFNDAMLDGPAALSNINTPALTWDAVNARCSQSYGFFEGWQVAGYLPVGKGDTFDKYPEDNLSLLQHGKSLKTMTHMKFAHLM